MRMRAFLSPTVRDHQMADAKRKRVAGGEPEKGGYVRLAPSVADFMGMKYCKESELTLSTLLASTRAHSVKKRQAVVSVATSSCASARKDGENEPKQINRSVPMKKSVAQWSTVKDNNIPASGRPQKHTGEHVSRRKRTAEAEKLSGHTCGGAVEMVP